MKFLTIEEVAEMLRAPLSTVRHWVATHKIRHAKPGRRVLIREDWLQAFVQSATRGGSE